MKHHARLRTSLRICGLIVTAGALAAGAALAQVANYEELILERQGKVVDYHGHLPGTEPVTPALAKAGKSTATLAAGGQGRNVEGNYKRFRQYDTPAEGGYAAEFGLQSVSEDGKTVFSGSLRTVTEDDVSSEGKLEYLPWGTDFAWDSRRSRFFRRFGPDDGRFERKDFAAKFSTPVGSEVDFDLGVNYVAVEGMDTKGAVGWQSVTANAGAYWTHGDLELEGDYSRDRFQQDGPEFGGSEDTFSVVVAPARNLRYMFEGSAWWRSDDFEDLSPSLNKWTEKGGAISLTANVLDDLLFYGKLSTQNVANSVTQNTYARNQKLASGVLTWSRWNWLTLEAGGEFLDTAYVSRFQGFTDEPHTSVYWTKAESRPCEDLKLYASYINRRIDAAPPSTLNDHTTDLPVLWDQYDRFRANATYSLGTRAGVSYDFTEAMSRVAPRDTDSRLTTHTATTWWSPSDDWTFYGSYLNLDWGLTGPGGAGIRPSDFTTDTDIVAAGATYRLSRDSIANVNYTHSSGFGALQTQEDVWDASWRHDLSDKTHLTIRYRFDQFDEFSANPSKDYRVHLLGAELGREF